MRPRRTVRVAVSAEDGPRGRGLRRGLGAGPGHRPASWRTRFQAHLRALHAERFEPPPYFTIEQITRLEEERHVAQAAATDHLARFAAASAYQVESLVVDAPPVDAILDASAGADLIVLGTHGRRGPGRWWLGSVAERVVRVAAIPVLVTRAGTHAAARTCSSASRSCRTAGTRMRRPAAAPRSWRASAPAPSSRPAPIAQCRPDVLQQASLVVMATRQRSSVVGADGPGGEGARLVRAARAVRSSAVNQTEVAT